MKKNLTQVDKEEQLQKKLIRISKQKSKLKAKDRDYKDFVARLGAKDLKDLNPDEIKLKLDQIYDWNDCSIYHYDLYRLKNPSEIYELGIEEAMTANVCLIEWPEKTPNLIPIDHARIILKEVENGKRQLILIN